MPKNLKQPPAKKLNADRSTPKASSQAMADTGKLINKVGPQSTIWQNNAGVSKSGLDAVAACAKVEQDDADINELQSKLDAKMTLKAADEIVCASKLDIYFSNVEDAVTNPNEMHDLGVNQATEHTYTLATPLGLTARSDAALHDIRVNVKRATGMQRCVIEVSPDPTFASGVRQFPGDGARQTMGPFPPGTYVVRACHTRAAERSLFTDPVTVVVK